jgi:hypothetical protein
MGILLLQVVQLGIYHVFHILSATGENLSKNNKTYFDLVVRHSQYVKHMRLYGIFLKRGNAFPPAIKCIQNSQTSDDYSFHISLYFATKLHGFTKFMTIF